MNDERVKSFLERILAVAKLHADSANQHTLEGNKFEFDVCDLLMKGAGGAIFFYIALLNLPSSSMRMNSEVFLYLGFSLALGIIHKIKWSRTTLKRASQEFKLHAQIMKELYGNIFSQENRDVQILKLWKDIADDEVKYYDAFIEGKETRKKDFAYYVPPKHYFPFLVIFQMVFIFLGAAAILNKFSLVIIVKTVLISIGVAK